MTGNLDNIVNLRVSGKSVEMAKTFKDLTGAKKSEIDRMAHILGLELIDEISRSCDNGELLNNVARRIETLIKMRHYDEVKNKKKVFGEEI